MNSISVFDERQNRAIRLIIQPDNSIQGQYFRETFPSATGLLFKDTTSSELFR